MISVNATHAKLLSSLKPLVMVELMTITLLNGQVYRYCNSPVVLSYAGNAYQPFSWERGSITTQLGFEVDNVELTLYPKVYPISARTLAQQDLLEGLPWIQAVRQGVLAGARVLLERGDIDPLSGPSIVGTLYQFSGQLAQPSFDDGLKLVVKSDLEVLNRKIPAQIYQPGCPFILFDSRCGLNADDWVVAGAVTAASTRTSIPCGLTEADEYFTLGKVELLTGQNAGTRRTVKSYTTGLLTLAGGLLYIPQVGDSFLAWPGCDKQRTTCDTKFSNTVLVNGVSVLRFGGQNYIPMPETAL